MTAYKSILITAVLALSVSTPALASYQEMVLADTPEAYWRLGESSGTIAYDSSGHGHNATYSGPTLGEPGAMAGDSDTAVLFDSSDLIQATGTYFIPNLDSWTVEAWVKAPSTSAQMPIVSWYAGGYALGHDGTYTLIIGDKGLPAYVIRDASGNSIAVTGTTPVTDSIWHHLVGVLDRQGGSVSLYVDGTEVASAPVTVLGLIADSLTIPLNVGEQYRDWAASPHFVGIMDEVAIYRSALSAERVSLHNAAGRGLAIDTDGDGVMDVLDKCPGTPLGLPVDAIGCIAYCPPPSKTEFDAALADALAAQSATVAGKDATISALNAEVNLLTAAVSSKDETIASLQTQISSLNATIAELQQQVTALKAQVSVMYTKEQLDQAVLSAQQSLVSTIPATLSGIFGDPAFALPGNSVTEQITALTSAIGSMPAGQIKKLQEQLTR
ncbi:MAG TPA: hypothetical protein DCZ75_04100 [Geobacter sp.]|nr:hypothetical protein [Geobacter sp.]